VVSIVLAVDPGADDAVGATIMQLADLGCQAEAAGFAALQLERCGYAPRLESAMKPTPKASPESAARRITQRIRELADWRGERLGQVRALIREADPDVVEEWKWMGTPVWSHDGIVCTGESYKEVVKLTFAKGASLKDPKKLFNASLDGNVRRAIDFREHDRIDGAAFRALFLEAVAYNREHPPKRALDAARRHPPRATRR